MPQGNRTGPTGQGPGTGRALGFCSGNDTPGYTKGFGGGMRKGSGSGMGQGRGHGSGRGRNFGRKFTDFSQGFLRQLSRDDEIKMLKSQAEELNRTQKDIEERLNELENQSK